MFGKCFVCNTNFKAYESTPFIKVKPNESFSTVLHIYFKQESHFTVEIEIAGHTENDSKEDSHLMILNKGCKCS